MTSAPPIPTAMTFEQLAELEPCLSRLEELIVELSPVWGRRKRRCRRRLFAKNVRPALVNLVGPYRAWTHRVLSSSNAFFTAYRHFFELMPECSEGCACLAA